MTGWWFLASVLYGLFFIGTILILGWAGLLDWMGDWAGLVGILLGCVCLFLGAATAERLDK